MYIIAIHIFVVECIMRNDTSSSCMLIQVVMLHGEVNSSYDTAFLVCVYIYICA